MPDVTIKVEARSMSRKRVEVTAGGFVMNVDEPKRLGGTDTGPNPLEYLLAALAGCLNVLGHAVAHEMGFTIDSMSVSIEGNLDPVAFTGRKPGVRPGYQEIRVHFKLETSAVQDTLTNWAEAIETRCPVSDNLINPTSIRITYES
ncbi:MAG: OsmC family protein [Armatimonadota bacterium]